MKTCTPYYRSILMLITPAQIFPIYVIFFLYSCTFFFILASGLLSPTEGTQQKLPKFLFFKWHSSLFLVTRNWCLQNWPYLTRIWPIKLGSHSKNGPTSSTILEISALAQIPRFKEKSPLTMICFSKITCALPVAMSAWEERMIIDRIINTIHIPFNVLITVHFFFDHEAFKVSRWRHQMASSQNVVSYISHTWFALLEDHREQ